MSNPSLSLNFNRQSLSAQRYLTQSTASLSRAFERLSSGQRINHADDDAAGLALSVSLRADKAVFQQGVRNLNDGISYASVIEAALGELSTIATRLSELAEQAASGTFSFAQRQSMNKEAKELTQEFNRIVSAAAYNGRNVLGDPSERLTIQCGYGAGGTIAAKLTEALGRTVSDGVYTGTELSSGAGGGADIRGVSAADLNNDSRSDIILCLDWAGIGVGITQADGSIIYHTYEPPSLSYSTIASTGDLNNDGNLDLVASDSASSSVHVFLGVGNGTFADATSFALNNPASYDAAGMVIADVDNDGNNDVIVATQQLGAARPVDILFGTGDGSLSAPVSSSPVAAQVRVADLNNDGLMDLAYASGAGAFTAIGRGDGTFAAAVTISASTRVEVGDLNLDGCVDLVAGSSSYLGNGDGTFRHCADTTVAGILLGDMNGDGILDAVAGGLDQGGNDRLAYGRGDGTFASPVDYGLAYNYISALGDFRGNGVLDIVNAGAASATVLLIQSGIAKTNAIQRVNLATQESARESIGVVEEIMDRIGLEEGLLGATQQRFRIACNALETARENYAAADNCISSIDVAEESALLIRSQIRQQAAAAVLAQANQSPARVLQLLQDANGTGGSNPGT